MLAVQFIVAWSMPDVGPETPIDRLISLHMSLGLVIALVVIARFATRISHPRATFAAPRWMRVSALISHRSMYVLLAVTPLLGWSARSAHAWSVSFMGAFDLPPLIPPLKVAGVTASDIHSLASYTLLTIIAIHVAATLYHRFVLRDQVLARMLPRGPRWRFLRGVSRQ